MITLHEGHRGRLRGKVKKAGPEILEKHELLELILFSVIPVRDTNKLSHKLFEKFGSFENIYSASISELCKVDGVGKKVAEFLKMQGDMYCALRDEAENKEIKNSLLDMNNSEVTEKIMKEMLSGKKSECLMLILADRKQRINFYDIILKFEKGPIEIDKKKILHLVSVNSARYAMVARNHLDNFVLPNSEDHRIAKELHNMLSLVGVKLEDFCVVTKSDFRSIRYIGLMPWQVEMQQRMDRERNKNFLKSEDLT